MANSDKNIVITPFIGSTTSDPQIVFSGASSTLGPQNITLKAYPTSNGTLSFEGSAGQLFSITNDLSGTIFSVNDVSGIPSIEVSDAGLIKLAQYSGNVLLGTGTDNGNKLQVVGTVSANNVTITGALSANGSIGTNGQTLRSDGTKAVWSTEVGYTGSVGFAGSFGATGFNGSFGATGFTGSFGATGFNGSRGFDGSKGFDGSRGFNGSIGFNGSFGATGFTGSFGATGFTGSFGNTGFTGSFGNTGFNGSFGATGFTGSFGATGFNGSFGATGFTGSFGATGFNGSFGATGFTGSFGNTGFNGSQGNHAGLRYAFSTTTTDADPGTGIFRFNNATIGAVTQIYIDILDQSSVDFLSYIDSWNGSTNATKGYILIDSNLNSDNTVAVFQLTSITTATGYRKLNVTYVSGTLPSNLEECAITFSRTGDMGGLGFTGSFGATGFNGSFGATGFTGSFGNTGFNGSFGATGFTGSFGATGFTGSFGATGFTGSFGATGFNGSQGPAGNFGGATFDYTFDTGTTNADPGIGKLRFNNANVTLATQLYIDDQNDASTDIQTFLRTIDDSTSTIKGHYRISNKLDASDFAIFTISSIVEETGHFTVNSAYVSGSATAFTNLEDVIITFARTGDIGATGFTGSFGNTGFNGSFGNTGFTGSKGDTGFNGSFGNTGFTGSFGNTGFNGSFGNTGFTGSKGDTGFTGSKGFDGSVGFTGSQGNQAGIRYNFSTTITDADPGNGIFRFNNATIASVTQIYIDLLDQTANDFTTYIDSWSASTNTVKGFISVDSNSNGDTSRAIFRLSSITTATGYRKLNVVYVSGTAPSDAEACVINFIRAGDLGFNGSVGFTGSFGNTGFNGSFGNTGFTGSFGNTGFNGSFGNTGFTGSKGDTGFTGSFGNTGFVGSKGAVLSWITVSGTHSAVAGTAIIAVTTAGSFTITLPAAPVAGDIVVIGDGNNFATNSLIVSGAGGKLIEGYDTFTLNVQHAKVEFVYDGTAWQAFATSNGSTGFTGSKGALLPWTYIFGNHLAVDGSRLIANTTAASFTVTLPATPVSGAYVQITDGGNWAVNNLLINRNGSTIEGIADTLAINIAQATVEFVYDGTTWQFTSTTGARGATGFVADDSAMIYAIALGF